MVQIDLITGFLGAGKTTFIKRYAKWLERQGTSIAVIENEFGTAGLDAQTLRDTGLEVAELSGGCICCGLAVDFHNSILALAETCDRIIVEPSGIFSMDDFFDVVLSPQVKAVCQPGAVITIVDPHSLDAMNAQDLEMLYGQLLCTGRVVLSKTDDLPQARVEGAINTLQALLASGHAAGRSIADIAESKPWDSFTDEDFARMADSAPVWIPHEKQDINHATLFNSATMYPEGAYTAEELAAIIDGITDGRCGAVLRIKGYVNAAQGGSLEVNCTAAERSIRACEYRKAGLNVIGRDLDRRGIRAAFG
ncbi:MAG: CobW family GTP-binding protein [Christensenellales bacterium]